MILTLNPGYVETVNKDLCLKMSDTQKGQLLSLMRDALKLYGDAIYDEHECSREQGDHYWQNLFLGLPWMPTRDHLKNLDIQSMRILHSCS